MSATDPPTDEQDQDDLDDLDEGPSFFDDLYLESAAPLRIPLHPERTIVVPVPDGDQVAELDDVDGAAAVLEVLLAPPDLDDPDGEPDPGDEDDLDELLEHYQHRPARELGELVDAIRGHYALAHPPAGGWAGLVDMLDRWGWGIEWDLLHLPNGPVLGDFVRDPARWPWTMLDRLLELLQQGSGYWAALMDDDDLAEAQHDAEDRKTARKPSTRPPLLGWTRQAERETSLIDVGRQQVHATWGASSKFKGKGGRPPSPSPRPRGAYQRVGRRRLLVEHDEIVGMLLPRGVEPPPDEAYVHPAYDPAYREDTPAGPQPGRAGPQRERMPAPEATRGAVLLGQNPADPFRPFGSS